MGMFGAVRKLVGGTRRDPFQDDESDELPRGTWKSPPGGKSIVWVIFQYGRPTQVELSRTDVNIDHLKKRLKSVFPRHLGHLEAFEFGVKSLPSDSSVIPEDTLLSNLRLGADASSALYIWLPCSSGAPSLVSPAFRHGCMEEEAIWRNSGHAEPIRFPPVGAPIRDDPDSVSDFESISTSVPPSYNSEAVRALLKERLSMEMVEADRGLSSHPLDGEHADVAMDNRALPGSPPAEDNCFSLQGSVHNEVYASAGDASIQGRSETQTPTKQVIPDFSVFHHDLAPADVAKLLTDGNIKGALGTQRYNRRALSAQPQRPVREGDPSFERSSFEEGFTAQLRKASLEDTRGGRRFEDEPRLYDTHTNSFCSSVQEHPSNEKPKFFSFQADGRWKRGSVGEQMQATAGRRGLNKPRSFWRSLFRSKTDNEAMRQYRPPPCASATRSTSTNSGLYSTPNGGIFSSPNSGLFSTPTSSGLYSRSTGPGDQRKSAGSTAKVREDGRGMRDASAPAQKQPDYTPSFYTFLRRAQESPGSTLVSPSFSQAAQDKVKHR